MSGKGSDRRPMNKKYCTLEEFNKRWDEIFKKKQEDKKSEDIPDVTLEHK